MNQKYRDFTRGIFFSKTKKSSASRFGDVNLVGAVVKDVEERSQERIPKNKQRQHSFARRHAVEALLTLIGLTDQLQAHGVHLRRQNKIVEVSADGVERQTHSDVRQAAC